MALHCSPSLSALVYLPIYHTSKRTTEWNNNNCNCAVHDPFTNASECFTFSIVE